MFKKIIPKQPLQRPEDAAGWIARLRSGKQSGTDAAAFSEWLAASDENRRDHENLSDLLLSLDQLRLHPDIMALREQVRPRPWLRQSAAAAIACCLVATGLTSAYFWSRPSSDREAHSPILSAFYETRPGQTSSFILTDGSRVFLDASSAVRVRIDNEERDIHLIKGRANFIVARNRELPFKVMAGDRSITALGTQFDVNLTERSVEVILEEGQLLVNGRTNIEDPRTKAYMTAGYRLVATEGNWTMAPVDTATLSQWRKGTLVFEEARVGDIVAELNRYIPAPIVISSSEIADRRMSAVLKAGDISTFLDSIDAIGLASWRATPGNGYELIETKNKKIYANR